MTLEERVALAIAMANLVPVKLLSLADLQSQGYIAMAKAAIEVIAEEKKRAEAAGC